MAAEIRGTFVLIDRASDKLKKIEAQAAKTQAAIEGVGASLDKQAAMSQKASGAADTHTRSTRALGAEMGKTDRAAKSYGQSADRLTRSHLQATQATSRFRTALAGLRAEFQRLRSPIQSFQNTNIGKLFGDKEAQRGLDRLESGFHKVASSVGVFGSALSLLKIPTLLASIQPLITAVAALGGGFLALLPRVGQLAQAFEALPAAVSLGAQTLISLKSAFSGVGQALGAAMQMQTQWGSAQQEWIQQVRDAQNGLIDAQQGYQESLYQVGQAQQSYTNALFSEHMAQEQLIATRRDATRQLQDMAFQARTAVLAEARAGLGVQQARLELQQAMATPGTTQLQIESDRLAVLEAQANAQQTHTQAVRSRADYQRVLRRDPSMPQVMALTQAQHALVTSSQEVANAQHGIMQAQEGVGRAARGLASAQRQLNLLLQHGNSLAYAYRKALAALPPAARQFVEFMSHNVLGRLREFGNFAASGLFPPLEKGIRSLLTVWGPLERIAHDTTRSIGQTVGSLMRVFADPAFIGRAGENNVRILDTLGQAAVTLGGAMKNLIIAGQGFLQWIANAVKHWAQLKEQEYGTADGLTRLEAKFKRVERAITLIGHAVKTWWDIFKALAQDAAVGLRGDRLWGALAGGSLYQKIRNNQAQIIGWFRGLHQPLHEIRLLVDAIGRGFAHMASTGAGGPSALTQLVQTLLQLAPIMGGILRNMTAMLPLVRLLAVGFGATLGFLTRILAMFLRIKPVAYAIAGLFAVAVVTRFFARWLSGLGGIYGGLKRILGVWERIKRMQSGDVMRSPGTTGDGSLAQRWSAAGGAVQAESLSRQWGWKSGYGPGSELNPLVVRLQGGGSSPLFPSTKDEPTGSLARKAEQDAAKATGLESDLVKAEGGAGLLATLRGKAGGLLSKGGGFLSRITGLGSLGADAGALAKIGTVASRAFLPLAALTTAIPAITSFFSTKGSFGQKIGAAGSSLISGLTLGLIHPSFGAPSAAHQQAQGISRANQFFGGLPMNPVTGVIGASGFAQYQARIARLRQEIYKTQNTWSHDLMGRPYKVAPDKAVLQDRRAQLAQLNQLMGREGTRAAQFWENAYSQAVQSGKKPQQAMQQLIVGLNAQLQSLGPSGKKAMAQNLLQWAIQAQASGELPKRQFDEITNYVKGTFRSMGMNINQTQTQLVQQLGPLWQQISFELTDPIAKAYEKLTGTFGAIQKEALGALASMGFNKNQAMQIIQGKATTTGMLGVIQGNAPAGAPGGAPAAVGGGKRQAAHAAGGRIAGRNPRDVYMLGNNVVGGGELVMNRWQEMDANARLMRHGEPTVSSIVANRKTPHWLGRASGGRLGYGGYLDPIPGFSLGRTDMGVDASAPPGTPIIAFGPSTMVGYQSNWYAGQPEMVFQLTGGPDSGRYWYVAEQIVPVARMHQSIPQGGVVARFAPHGTGIEIGWAANAGGTTLAQATTGYTEGQVTPAGASFRQLIQGGAFSVPGAGPSPQMINLKPPLIRGLGGVPLALAQRGAAAMAAGMNQAVNNVLSQMGGAGGGVGIPGGLHGPVPAQIYQAATQLGWNKVGVAGLIGNAYQESSLNPSLNVPGGRGLFSWNPGGNPQAFQVQLGNIGQQIALVASTIGRGGINAMNNAGSPAAAAIWFEQNFERAGIPMMQNRINAANQAFSQGYAAGGRLAHAGWFQRGGSFVATSPTLFGAGEGGRPERVTVEPLGRGDRPLHVEIHKIEVNRKGDVQRIVDEEMRLLAASFERSH